MPRRKKYGDTVFWTDKKGQSTRKSLRDPSEVSTPTTIPAINGLVKATKTLVRVTLSARRTNHSLVSGVYLN